MQALHVFADVLPHTGYAACLRQKKLRGLGQDVRQVRGVFDLPQSGEGVLVLLDHLGPAVLGPL